MEYLVPFWILEFQCVYLAPSNLWKTFFSEKVWPFSRCNSPPVKSPKNRIRLSLWLRLSRCGPHTKSLLIVILFNYYMHMYIFPRTLSRGMWNIFKLLVCCMSVVRIDWVPSLCYPYAPESAVTASATAAAWAACTVTWWQERWRWTAPPPSSPACATTPRARCT